MFRNRKGLTPRGNSGQSTVEYIILVTAVLGVLIVFLIGNNNMFSQRLGNTYNQVGNGMADKMQTLTSAQVDTVVAPSPKNPVTDFNVVTNKLL